MVRVGAMVMVRVRVRTWSAMFTTYMCMRG